MVERFVAFTGTISIANGESTVTGSGTLFGGRDREGAQVRVHPVDAAPYDIGTVAAVDPRGIYDNLSLPLVHAWNGDDVVDQPYELIDGPAIANGSTQASIYARFTAFLEQTMGLAGNLADEIDYSLVPNNTLFVDSVTRSLFQWRNGILETVALASAAFLPRGAYDGDTTYATNDLVQIGNAVFVSNQDANIGNAPVTSPAPASDAWWTVLFLGTGASFADIFVGGPGALADAEEFFGIVFDTTIVFPASLTGSRANCGIAPTADATITLKKNGVSFATVTFAAGQNTGTFTAASDTTFTGGDVLTAVGQATADITLANVRITLRGSTEIGSPVNQYGTAVLDFGAFPGASDGSVTITGQGKIAAGSLVQAWIAPGSGTVDHSADEHLLADLDLVAMSIVAGTGFTIRAVARNGRAYGQFNVGWRWN